MTTVVKSKKDGVIAALSAGRTDCAVPDLEPRLDQIDSDFRLERADDKWRRLMGASSDAKASIYVKYSIMLQSGLCQMCRIGRGQHQWLISQCGIIATFMYRMKLKRELNAEPSASNVSPGVWQSHILNTNDEKVISGIFPEANRMANCSN